jgi:hypothetical protein
MKPAAFTIVVAVLASYCVVGCNCDPRVELDAGIDAGMDASRDAYFDAVIDAADAAFDAPQSADVGVGVTADSGVDSGVTAASDSGFDANACSPCHVMAPQCGCAPGEACYPEIIGRTVCAPEGSGAMGSYCMRSQDCAPTLACHGYACSVVCDDGSDPLDICAGPHSMCVQWDATFEFASCNIACDPVFSTPCGASMACRIRSVVAGFYHTTCAPEGSRAAGQSCGQTFDCQRGLVCMPSALGSVCRRICQMSSMLCTCNPHPTLFVNDTQYGYCT